MCSVGSDLTATQSIKILCPICGEGNLHYQVSKNPVEYKGQVTELDLRFSLCDACGSEQADAAQTRANKRLMIAFKKRVDHLRMKFGLVP